MPKTPSSRSRVTRSSLSKPYARRSKSDVEDTAGSGIEKARLISQEEKNAWEATRCCICLENPHVRKSTHTFCHVRAPVLSHLLLLCMLCKVAWLEEISRFQSKGPQRKVSMLVLEDLIVEGF
jgi:hypothetical protein